MRKLLAVLLVVMLFAAPAAAAEKTLGLVISTLNNPFFVTLKEGAEEAAAKAGVKLVILDAQDDSAKMTAAMEDLVQQKVDAILVNPTDSDAVTPSIMKANEAGIPVLTIDRGASGGKGKVVELVGIPGTSAARDRGQGFNDAMKAYPGIEIVASQAADFSRDKGLKVFENILQAQPEIDGVFAHNDEMILGAVAAAEAAGRTGIVFVGFDAVDDAVAAVKEGKLAATVAQQPAVIGAMGVEKAAALLAGEELPEFIPVPLQLVTE